MHILDRFLGDPGQGLLRKLQKTVEQINALEPKLEELSDEDLQAKTEIFKTLIQEKLAAKEEDPLALLEIKDRLAHKREINAVLDTILPEAFAVVREAAKRTVGQRHFDVQLLGGMV